MDKPLIRKSALGKRNAIAPKERESMSGIIAQNALSLREVQSAKMIACFLPIGSEVATRPLIEKLLSLGKQVCIPVEENHKEVQALKFARLFSLGDRLATSGHGAQEPVEKDFVDPKSIGLFFVPGTAFDRGGARLGWGRGFYDRFFGYTKARGFRIGLAYGFQVVEFIPVEGHDVLMDALVTENGVLRF